MHYQPVTLGDSLLCTLDYGESLVGEFESLMVEADLPSAWVLGSGGVEEAELAYYDQDAFELRTVSFSEPLQVPILMGSMTRAGTDPEVALYGVLARPSGQALAGRITSATVFGGEVYVQGFEEDIARERDEATDMSVFSL